MKKYSLLLSIVSKDKSGHFFFICMNELEGLELCCEFEAAIIKGKDILHIFELPGCSCVCEFVDVVSGLLLFKSWL